MKREKSIPDIWGIRQRTDELASLCTNGRYAEWFDSIIEKSDTLLKHADAEKTDSQVDVSATRVSATRAPAARVPAEEAVTLAWAWLFTKTHVTALPIPIKCRPAQL